MNETGGDEAAAAAWRRAVADDLDAVMAIQADVHTLMQERRDVFADKLRLCGEGCLVLVREGRCVGYGIAHPWVLDDVPPLDTVLGALPDAPDCVFVHDVAILPGARRRGAGQSFIRRVSRLARDGGWPALALVSVYNTYPMWERCGFAVRAVPSLARKLAPFGDTARYMTAPPL